ncbi:MAG: cobalamin-dependent protein, partial [Myxococcota bacterium]
AKDAQDALKATPTSVSNTNFSASPKNELAAISNQLHQHLIHNRGAEALKTIEDAIFKQHAADTLYRNVINKVMRKLVKENQGQKVQLHLPTLHNHLERVLERLWSFFSGRIPSKGLVVMGRPTGESGSLKMLVTFLRAAGFSVMDLGSRVTPSHFVQTVTSTNADLLCIMLRTEVGIQNAAYVRQLLNHQGLGNVPMLVGGPLLNRHPEHVQRTGASACATDALDLVQKTYYLTQTR